MPPKRPVSILLHDWYVVASGSLCVHGHGIIYVGTSTPLNAIRLECLMSLSRIDSHCLGRKAGPRAVDQLIASCNRSLHRFVEGRTPAHDQQGPIRRSYKYSVRLPSVTRDYQQCPWIAKAY